MSQQDSTPTSTISVDMENSVCHLTQQADFACEMSKIEKNNPVNLPSDERNCSICSTHFWAPFDENDDRSSTTSTSTRASSESANSDRNYQSNTPQRSCDDDSDDELCGKCCSNHPDYHNSADKHESPIRIGCGHVFGDACLGRWLRRNNTCPMCRWEVYPKRSAEWEVFHALHWGRDNDGDNDDDADDDETTFTRMRSGGTVFGQYAEYEGYSDEEIEILEFDDMHDELYQDC